MLAAGKGVIIAPDEREARAALDVFFAEKRFGDTEVVLEEFLDGRGALPARALRRRARGGAGAGAGLQARIRDGDEGPNTGGMGSYSPVPGFDREAAEELVRLGSPADRGRAAPPRNALPRHPLRGPDDDLRRPDACSSSTAASAIPRRRPCSRGCAATCVRAARGRGHARAASRASSPSGRTDWAVTVVLAAGGYPASYSTGDEITGLDGARRGRVPRGHGRGGRRAS